MGCVSWKAQSSTSRGRRPVILENFDLILKCATIMKMELFQKENLEFGIPRVEAIKGSKSFGAVIKADKKEEGTNGRLNIYTIVKSGKIT